MSLKEFIREAAFVKSNNPIVKELAEYISRRNKFVKTVISSDATNKAKSSAMVLDVPEWKLERLVKANPKSEKEFDETKSQHSISVDPEAKEAMLLILQGMTAEEIYPISKREGGTPKIIDDNSDALDRRLAAQKSTTTYEISGANTETSKPKNKELYADEKKRVEAIVDKHRENRRYQDPSSAYRMKTREKTAEEKEEDKAFIKRMHSRSVDSKTDDATKGIDFDKVNWKY